MSHQTMVELLVSINIYETRTAFWSDICRSEIHPELRHQCAARIFNSLAAWPPGHPKKTSQSHSAVPPRHLYLWELHAPMSCSSHRQPPMSKSARGWNPLKKSPVMNPKIAASFGCGSPILDHIYIYIIYIYTRMFIYRILTHCCMFWFCNPKQIQTAKTCVNLQGTLMAMTSLVVFLHLQSSMRLQLWKWRGHTTSLMSLIMFFFFGVINCW